MHSTSTTRFVTRGLVAAVVLGLITFAAFSALYPTMLSPSDVASLAHNGKTVGEESAGFGFIPAFGVTVGILAYVADSYMIRRRTHKSNA
jgi:hypothetical protein